MKMILVIDDDESVRNTYRLALEHAGYQVFVAENGARGLALARQAQPDLVLCDINMPEMDGWAVLQHLRADPEVGTTQFVLITGNRMDITPRQGMESGADDFLVKPCTIDELHRCVQARLQRAQLHWRVEDKVVSGLRTTLRTTLPHELLTPLAGILGLTDILLTERDKLKPEEVHEMLLDIDRAGKRFHRTLMNYLKILELAGDATRAPALAGPLSAPEVRQAIGRGLTQAAERHQRIADLAVELADCALPVPADTVAIVAEELMDNACSFSRPGSPIRVELAAGGQLMVRDAGRGMAPREITQIGAFRQFDRQKYEQQGLGLGLVLTQRLLAQCGGRLEIASAPGQGTTVTAIFSSN